MDPGLLRFLELVKRELNGVDARIEVGGFPPNDDRCVWTSVPGTSGRLVLVLEQPPQHRNTVEKRLANLASGFADTIERGWESSVGKPTAPSSARARLDSELTSLALRAGAERVVVFDTSSPMIWGASIVEGRDREQANHDLEGWVEELRSERADELRTAHGHVVRLPVGSDLECLARMFGGLYVLALTFKGSLSEPVAVGALLHAADAIERLVLALPPVDPPPGGKVIRLPRRKG